ncbi:MAG: hypothetical protein RIS47_698, partial [Bacteroidota bacterium]
RDFPHLRGKPVVVGSPNARGVISAASYEARVFGVRSAMPSKMALAKCPQLIFMPHRFSAYQEVSMQIHQIFEQYTDLIEPLSLDEAYLDVSENKLQFPSATLLAKDIKRLILQTTHLTASAGVSYNKFLAKTASDWNKPNGIYTITPDMALDFIAQLPIEKFYGVGQKTALRMKHHGIHTGADLRKLELYQLIKLFGKSGSYFFDIARGIDNRQVQPHRDRKSLGAENTFEADLREHHLIEAELNAVVETLWRRLDQSNYRGRTLTLKVKFADFEQITRSYTQIETINDIAELRQSAADLLTSVELTKGVRLIGLSVSNAPSSLEAVQLRFKFW